MEKTQKVVVIGGGTGIFSVLSGLKKYPLWLSAIVTMADNGGSSGILREEFGILPPGDVRRALADRKLQVLEEDLLRRRGFIRHDPEKTASVLFNLINTQ